MSRAAPSRNSLDRILTAVVDERARQKNRVSRYLHDEVGQILSAVGLQLDCLRLDVEPTSPETAAQLLVCQEHLGKAIEQVRALSQDQSPDAVQRLGLWAALERLIDRDAAGHSEVHLRFDPSIELPSEVADAFFQIAECGLDNALRHARAERIDVIVRDDRGGVVLEIRDNGLGFPAKTMRPGLGLLLIVHFAAEAGLQSKVTSTPGKGTIVKARCPAAKLRHGFKSSAG